jgi:hypothetical protein
MARTGEERKVIRKQHGDSFTFSCKKTSKALFANLDDKDEGSPSILSSSWAKKETR